MAGGARRIPNNQNGGSSADSWDPRPGGILGRLNVRARPSPDPLVPPDGLRPRLFRGGGGGQPVFLLIPRELSSKLAWLSVAL